MTVRAKRARKNRKSSGAMLFSSDYSLQQSFERKLCCASDEDAKHKLRHKRKLLKPIFSRRMQAKQQGIKKKPSMQRLLLCHALKAADTSAKATQQFARMRPRLRYAGKRLRLYTRVCAGTQAHAHVRITHVCASTRTRMRTHAYEKKKKDTRMCTRVTHVCASTRTQAHARVHTRKKRGACVRAHHTGTCTRITKTKKIHVRALTRARVRKKTRKIFHRRVRSRARAYEKKSEKYFSSTCVHACVCVCDVCVCVGVCVGAQARMKKKK